MNALALASLGHPNISGTTGTGIVIVIIAGILLFVRRRGHGWETILAIIGVLIIVFGFLGGVHPHSVPIP